MGKIHDSKQISNQTCLLRYYPVSSVLAPALMPVSTTGIIPLRFVWHTGNILYLNHMELGCDDAI